MVDWAEQARRVALAREMLASGEAREMRTAEGISREAIAVRAGFTSRALAGWEVGRGFPSNRCALAWWDAMAQL
jgi:DNA-binding transcriptional regulator YiaG